MAPAPGAFSLQSLNPDISFVGDVAFAYFSADEPLMSGGHDPQANGFTLQQLEMSVSKSVDPYFRFDSNIVFSLYGVEIEE
ncbi:MAG: zinc-regulated TonB-dependent outer membrane receptor, partial [Pseudomonadota bacterium]|nr:zinc-regulated TonB-dependent outer membrane receptor [Pseudomonadota bacterium]